MRGQAGRQAGGGGGEGKLQGAMTFQSESREVALLYSTSASKETKQTPD